MTSLKGEVGVDLPKQLADALSEVGRYEGQNRLYWWRRASMEKLAALGLTETYTPPSMAGSRGKQRPYRITAAGRAAIAKASALTSLKD